MSPTTKPAAKAGGRPRRNPAPMVAASAVALLLVVGAFVLAGGSSGDATPDPGASADAIGFTYFDGSAGSTDDFVGTPTVVNFWASWCGPCLTEMPDFEQVFQSYGDRVAFVGFDVQDPLEAGLATVAETGVTYTLAQDPDGAIHRAYGGIGMPTTAFVDETGRVVRVHTGLLRGEDLVQIIETELLA